MRIFAYALLGFLALQSLAATPALAMQPVAPLSVDLSGNNLSAGKVEKAFLNCGAQRGWKIKRISSGNLVGQLLVRGKHYVAVDIAYSSKGYTITYRDSKNMKYNAEKNVIHNRYKSWVDNLSNDVIFCL